MYSSISYSSDFGVNDIKAISEEKKHMISLLAKSYSEILSNLPFDKGAWIFSRSHDELKLEKGKIHFCLLCGTIGTLEDFNFIAHECPLLIFQNLPMLISTSWVKLKDFFLTNEYLNVLREVGIKVIKGPDEP